MRFAASPSEPAILHDRVLADQFGYEQKAGLAPLRGKEPIELLSHLQCFGVVGAVQTILQKDIQVGPCGLGPAQGLLARNDNYTALAPGRCNCRCGRITQQVEQRRALQASMQKLVEQREAEVAVQMKAAEGTDEVVVLSPFCVIQEQAESKGFQFSK